MFHYTGYSCALGHIPFFFTVFQTHIILFKKKKDETV